MSYLTACPGCRRPVPGIFCPSCRDDRERARREALAEHGARLRAAWRDDPEGMRAKLAAGRAAKHAPAQEGAPE